MRAVLDTNVLISAVIATGTPHEIVVAGYSGAYEIIASPATVTEFRTTLQKYPDRFGLSDSAIDAEVETLCSFATIVEPTVSLSLVDADPDDDTFLAVAVTAEADYVISGDSHLLDLGSVRGIEICSPREFFEHLRD